MENPTFKQLFHPIDSIVAISYTVVYAALNWAERCRLAPAPDKEEWLPCVSHLATRLRLF